VRGGGRENAVKHNLYMHCSSVERRKACPIAIKRGKRHLGVGYRALRKVEDSSD